MPKPKKAKDPSQTLSAAGLRDLMEETFGGLDLHRRSAADRAQDLVYQAMEARTPARRLRLATQALDLDPENVDALLMLTDAVPLGEAARITVLRDIVAVGAKRLGPETFKKLAPHFWGHLETRPYMRAREYLAEDLRAAGRLEEAVQEYTGMLALNENDNQGMRLPPPALPAGPAPAGRSPGPDEALYRRLRLERGLCLGPGAGFLARRRSGGGRQGTGHRPETEPAHRDFPARAPQSSQEAARLLQSWQRGRGALFRRAAADGLGALSRLSEVADDAGCPPMNAHNYGMHYRPPENNDDCHR